MTKMTAETHEQSMACFSCGLAGLCPPEHFPQADGPWDRPCPKCGGTVWVTEPREKFQGSSLDLAAAWPRTVEEPGH